jgi:hypothetical protein
VLRLGLPADHPLQHGAGLAPHPVLLDANGGERRIDAIHHRHVVVAGDRNVLGAFELETSERGNGSDRQPVVSADDRREIGAAGDQPCSPEASL